MVEFCRSNEGSGFLLGIPSLRFLLQACKKGHYFANRFEAHIPQSPFQPILMLQAPVLTNFPHSSLRKLISGLILKTKCSRTFHPPTLLSMTTYSSYTSHPRASFLPYKEHALKHQKVTRFVLSTSANCGPRSSQGRRAHLKTSTHDIRSRKGILTYQLWLS